TRPSTSAAPRGWQTGSRPSSAPSVSRTCSARASPPPPARSPRETEAPPPTCPAASPRTTQAPRYTRAPQPPACPQSTAAGWASATPAPPSAPPGRRATCAPARSTPSPAAASRSACPPPSATSRSNSELTPEGNAPMTFTLPRPTLRLPNPFARSAAETPEPEPVVLSAESVETIGRELDAIRDRVVADLGTADREYILGVVRTQRRLELAGRALMFGGFLPPLWLA